MTDKRYFTAHEIDGLIPQLETLFDHIQTCKSRAEELAAQVLRPNDPTEPADIAKFQLMRSQVEFLMRAIEEDVEQIQKLGGITKDVELGLVDFLGDVSGRDVWLCWKRGEKHVRFWHPLDGGYSQRRALPQPSGRHRMH